MGTEVPKRISEGVIVQIPLKGELQIDQVGNGTPVKGLENVSEKFKVRDSTLEGVAILRSQGST
jgi:hypothetical protein